jgi:hypothetical protein
MGTGRGQSKGRREKGMQERVKQVRGKGSWRGGELVDEGTKHAGMSGREGKQKQGGGGGEGKQEQVG